MEFRFEMLTFSNSDGNLYHFCLNEKAYSLYSQHGVNMCVVEDLKISSNQFLIMENILAIVLIRGSDFDVTWWLIWT